VTATRFLSRLGSGWTRTRRLRASEDGQGTLEYIGIIAAVAAVIALVAVAFASPGARTATVEGVQDLVCAVTSGPGCAGEGPVAGPGTEDGGGEDGGGEDGAGDDGGCEGFWGCTWSGVQQVGSGIYNIGKGAVDDVVGLYELVRDPGQIIDAFTHLWNNPGDLWKLVWDDESGGMWDSGDYGGAIGRTIWNVGSWFIPGVNIAKIGSKAGKFGKIADLVSELAGLRKLADDAAAAADRAADAARRGDVDAAQKAADEARKKADEAAEEARKRGCPIAAGTPGPGSAGLYQVPLVAPLLQEAGRIVAGGTGCGDATDASRDADEAADAAEAAAARAQRIDDLAKDPAHGGRISDASRAEAEVGLGLEEAGQVPGPITRSTNPGEEFVDASGQAWDVKAFRSEVPGSRGGFTVDSAMTSIRREVQVGENVMVDTRNMTPAHVTQLREAIAADPSLAGKVLFYP